MALDEVCGAGIRIRMNGREHVVERGTTVRGLLDRIGAPGKGVAVERNRAVVPRAELETVVLEEGDQVEVVTLVGGG